MTEKPVHHHPLFLDYQCPKCRNRTCVTEEVSLTRTGWLWQKKTDPYIIVTCGLCGYSELYSKLIRVQMKEPEPVSNVAPAPTKAE